MPKWLSGWAPAFGSGRDPRIQDQVLHQAPCREPASPACVSASLCVSHEEINKILKKNLSLFFMWTSSSGSQVSLKLFMRFHCSGLQVTTLSSKIVQCICSARANFAFSFQEFQESTYLCGTRRALAWPACGRMCSHTQGSLFPVLGILLWHCRLNTVSFVYTSETQGEIKSLSQFLLGLEFSVLLTTIIFMVLFWVI